MLTEELAGRNKPGRAEGHKDVSEPTLFNEVQQLHSLPSCPGDSFVFLLLRLRHESDGKKHILGLMSRFVCKVLQKH